MEAAAGQGMTVRRHELLTAAGLAAAAVLLYILTLENGFAYDDVALVATDTDVRSLRNLPALFLQSYWPAAEHALYRPLTKASFATDWALYRGNPWGFHLTNTLLNAAVVILVFLLLLRLSSYLGALIGALVFAALPVHVEAVANIVARAELFAALFVLLAALLWLRPGSARNTLQIALCYALALLSKESAIMLPLLLALLAMATGELRPQNVRTWLIQHRARFAALAMTAVLFLIVRGVVVGWQTTFDVNAAMAAAGSGTQRVQTALQVWPFIIRLLLYPATLLADYAPRVIMPAAGWTPLAIGGLLILTCLVAGGSLAWAAGRCMTACMLLWLPVSLLPASNLIFPIGVLLAERTLYLPSLSLSFAAAGAITWLSTRGHRNAQFAVAGMLLVLCVVASACVLARIPDWYDTNTLFTAQLRDAPQSYRVQWQQARLAVRRNQPDSASARYDAAIQLWPDSRPLVLEAAVYSAHTRNWPASQRLAEHMLARWPDDLGAHRVAAMAALQLGDTAAARRALTNGMRYHPQDAVLRELETQLLARPESRDK